jgi:hypothetical protein
MGDRPPPLPSTLYKSPSVRRQRAARESGILASRGSKGIRSRGLHGYGEDVAVWGVIKPSAGQTLDRHKITSWKGSTPFDPGRKGACHPPLKMASREGSTSARDGNQPGARRSDEQGDEVQGLG